MALVDECHRPVMKKRTKDVDILPVTVLPSRDELISGISTRSMALPGLRTFPKLQGAIAGLPQDDATHGKAQRSEASDRPLAQRDCSSPRKSSVALRAPNLIRQPAAVRDKLNFGSP